MSRTSTRRPRRRRRKSILAVLILALAAALAMFMQECGLGLGSGSDFATDLWEQIVPEQIIPVDAAPATDAAPDTCDVYLNAASLTLNGRERTVAEVVQRCRRVGRASVRAIGSAPAKRYDQLIRELRQAGIRVTIERDRVRK